MAGAIVFDRKELRRRRAGAAANVNSHSFLADRVAEDIAERLSIVQRQFANCADIGAHHGVLARALANLDNVGSVVSVEPVEELLDLCPHPRILADEEVLPFAPESLDLVVSGLALQFVNDLPGTFAQIRRALKPDGLFVACMAGGQTLSELRHSWLIAEEEVCGGASARVAPTADVRELGGLLQRAGFALPVVDADVVRVTYSSSLALMRELKAMGAGNVLVDRRRVPVTRSLLARACAVYDEMFCEPDGRVNATFELITLTAWAPHESQQKPLQPGSAKTRLADALGSVELPAGEKAGGGQVGSPGGKRER